MRKYRNDSLINEHKAVYIKPQYNEYIQVLAPLNLHKGGRDGRPAAEQLVAICTRPLTSDDSRTGVQRTKNSSIDDTVRPAMAVVPDITSRRSPQSDHFTNVVVQLLRCRLSWPPRVSADVTQRRRTITFKLFDAPLHESSAANSTIFTSVGRT